MFPVQGRVVGDSRIAVCEAITQKLGQSFASTIITTHSPAYAFLENIGEQKTQMVLCRHLQICAIRCVSLLEKSKRAPSESVYGHEHANMFRHRPASCCYQNHPFLHCTNLRFLFFLFGSLKVTLNAAQKVVTSSDGRTVFGFDQGTLVRLCKIRNSFFERRERKTR